MEKNLNSISNFPSEKLWKPQSVDVGDSWGHVDSNTRSQENIQLPMNGLPEAPVS